MWLMLNIRFLYFDQNIGLLDGVKAASLYKYLQKNLENPENSLGRVTHVWIWVISLCKIDIKSEYGPMLIIIIAC